MKTSEVLDKYTELRGRLLAAMNSEGYWTGRLSTSALSTAVAIVALKVAGGDEDSVKAEAGLEWLYRNINNDGGYGDTAGSVSNVSTTLLCYAAVSYCRKRDEGEKVLADMEKWLGGHGIVMDAHLITNSLLKYYGRDYTFSIPILSMLTICGVLPLSSLNRIPVLPFELALLPRSWYTAFNLRVVSYALPALIGVGIYLNKNRKKRFPGDGMFRGRSIKPAIKKLESIMPESGGFLEAIPLTGFVAMCLAESGLEETAVVGRGLEFLRRQQREDGGWPIDTDLSTWVTTLSVKALGDQLRIMLDQTQITKLKNHLLSLQYRESHPFYGAEPGGWRWTKDSGSVPDADDTPGAIIALLSIYEGSSGERAAIENGCRWLVRLQNRDGGFPTFCKGWGRLPFDRSCADLTGHAMLALAKASEVLYDKIPPDLKAAIEKSISMGMGYLTRHQSDDGAWLPLWFGNQLTPQKINPVYGTARVCAYLSDCLTFDHIDRDVIRHLGGMVFKAGNFLVSCQNDDGSWGGDKGITGSVEETALAVSALSATGHEACEKALEWLGSRQSIKASPIGLYFSMLWYDEELYPLIFSTEALRRYLGF